jgi:hypothetical protein
LVGEIPCLAETNIFLDVLKVSIFSAYYYFFWLVIPGFGKDFGL